MQPLAQQCGMTGLYRATLAASSAECACWLPLLELWPELWLLAKCVRVQSQHHALESHTAPH